MTAAGGQILGRLASAGAKALRPLRARALWYVWLLATGLLWACGGKGGGGNGNNNCPEGFRPEGRACVPIFDDCPGPAEIPVLGGGCQPVGVTECATGFVSDGEGGCDPILPSQPCPPGTMEIIGQTECQPVGVTQCAQGFVSDGEGGCDAILPPGPDPCPFGTMEVLGHTECQPIGDCGTGTWGSITTDATTIFVDQTADATGADGSDASPFTTIEDALAVVQPGGQIAVAAGDYTERLQINQRLHLAGRCAELVTIRGMPFLGQDRPPVAINPGGSGSTVRGVKLTGDGEGLVVRGATEVTVQHVQVLDTGSYGVSLHDEAEASLRRVVVAGCTQLGIYCQASNLEVIESVVRDTNPDQNGNYGRGISAECDSTTNVCGSLTVTGSLVAGNSGLGIFSGVDVVVTSTVVRDTLPQHSDGMEGMGIGAQCDDRVGVCPSLTVTGSLVAGNRTAGILGMGVHTSVTSTVVRETLPEVNGRWEGRGIDVLCDTHAGACGSLTVTGSLVAGNSDVGICSAGSDTTISFTIIRDTQPEECTGELGRGISLQCYPNAGTCANLTLTGSLVVGNKETAIFIEGSVAEITSTLIKDTLPQESDGSGGRGIVAQCNPAMGAIGTLTVTGCIVAGNRGMGILVTGGDGAISSTIVRGTRSQASGGFGRGIDCQCCGEGGQCGNLTVTGSLLAGNADVGIRSSGVDTTISSTVVRDTLPREDDGKLGIGIGAVCNGELGTCGSLAVTESLVAGNESEGIFIGGVHTELSGVAVKDTVPNETGDLAGQDGHGIFAVCYYPAQGRYCPLLLMTQCLVESSYTVGVAIHGGLGSMQGSVIRNVYVQPLDDAYGYGLQVEGLIAPGAGQTFFDVQSSQIIDATLAGVLYTRAQGTVAGSEVGGAGFSIVMNQGASVTVTDDNSLSGDFEDEPSWQNMEPSPAPAPALPDERL